MWRTRKCPVRAEEQQWIEESLHWLRAQFGNAVLHGEVVPPTAEFFPDPYTGDPEDVRHVLQRVCDQMAVDADTLDLTIVPLDVEQGDAQPVVQGCDDAETRYQPGSDHSRIAVRSDLARTPVSLVAALAHQVGHVQLLRAGRILVSRRDHEPLTDLLTVYCGLGIFAANAALTFHKRTSSDPLSVGHNVRTVLGGGGRALRLGFMTEPMFGYALAYYTWLRDEPKPSWTGYLDTNPRVYMKRGLRYLQGRATP